MLSDTIKSLRKKKGLSQAQIAIKLGITQGAISQWEHGLTEPASDQLLALAQIFGVSVYELKGVDEPKQKEPTASDGQTSPVDGNLAEMYAKFSLLSPADQQRVLDFAEGILSARER